MNLEEELRAVLSQEAEMRTTPTPDIEGMVKGGQDRRRDRKAKRIGLAAAAVLLIGGGVYGVAQLGHADADADSGVTSLPTGPTEDRRRPLPRRTGQTPTGHRSSPGPTGRS